MIKKIINDKAIPEPLTSYDLLKTCSDQLIEYYQKIYNLNCCSIRFSNIYGADFTLSNSKNRRILNKFVEARKEIDPNIFTSGENKFEFKLPASKRTIEFRLLTHGDEGKIQSEIKANKKSRNRINGVSPELSTRLKYMIVSVDGEYDRMAISKFVENEFLSRDSLAFREYMNKISPDIDLTYNYYGETDGQEHEITLPMTVQFFWPRV